MPINYFISFPCRRGFKQPLPVSALILAGGLGTRMGGQDKGNVILQGKSLIQHVIDHITFQVKDIFISANRQLSVYEKYGYPILKDLENYTQMGPLSGLVSLAEQQISNDLILLVPCDTPSLPSNLVEKLFGVLSIERGIYGSYATTHDGEHPSVCLTYSVCLSNIKPLLNSGNRKLKSWLDTCSAVPVFFEDRLAFTNINDNTTLRALDI